MFPMDALLSPHVFLDLPGFVRSGAGVGVGILRGTIMFEDLKDSKN